MSEDFDPKKMTELLPQEVARLLSELSDVEKSVIQLAFGLSDEADPKSHDQIAQELNLSVDEVVEIEQRAMNRLRHPKAE